MLCENCKEKKASVHFSEIKNGIKAEMNLCEDCAKEKNNISLGHNLNIPFSIQDIFSSIMNADVDNVFSKRSEITCPKCGSTYTRFRNTGKFGCVECYETFKDQVYPLVKRVQGATEHIGKIPKKAAGPMRIRKNINQLKIELNSAISSEDFEKAVEIRDQIRALEKELSENEK